MLIVSTTLANAEPAAAAANSAHAALSGGFNAWAALGVLLLMALTFGFGNLIVTHLLGPSRKGETKGVVYESGMNPIGSARRRFNVRFFVVAMTFLLFDVEVVFLYPWATTFPALADDFQGHGMYLGRMLFFMLTTILAFAYAWRKGVFRYD
ncbi:MAG: NADH-quinone oxidoreductase subunit A [Planctomycetota bacterium]